MMTGGWYGDTQRRVQSLGSEQTLAVQQTLVFYTAEPFAKLSKVDDFIPQKG